MTVKADVAPFSVHTHPWAAALRWLLPLAAVLALAAAVRVPHLGRHGYELDEMWTAEVSLGRGSPHVDLPTDRLLWPAPELCRLTAAAPAWQVWSHMAITHPPLYSVLLRLWQDLFGTGDGRERGLSVVASIVAVGLLYDTVRVRAGVGPAFWAAALMAVAVPQVEYARITRGYTVLAAVALAVADVVTRIDVRGPTRRRAVTLAVATAATLLTHYFAVATVAAVAAYAAIYLRGPAWRAVLMAMGVGAAAFAVTWLPFVPGQMHLFADHDPATDFLYHDGARHVARTLWRVALVPVSMLFAPSSASAPFAAGGAVLYAVPLVVGRRPTTRGLAFWGLWLCGTVGLLAGLDLARGSSHLFYVRYPLLAGPAVFALVPMVLSATFGGGRRWVAHAVPAVAVVACLAAVWSDAYVSERADTREVVAAIVPPLSADDLLVLTTPPRTAQFAGALYLLVDRYRGPLPCPVVVLTRPASPAVTARLRASRGVWMLSDGADWRPYLPGITPAHRGLMFPGIGLLWHVAGR